mgnify:FL=1|jgi:L-threonylcarbamoyladenylate synthase
MNEIDVHNKDAVVKALKVIEDGGIIIYPTDTIYGFGVDAANDEAIEKLNLIKRRNGPMSVLAPNSHTVLSWSHISNNDIKLVEANLKGQSTIIIPVRKGIVSHKILGKNQTLGVRIPNNTFCNQLAKKSLNPITTTSVNRHNSRALNDPAKILEEFQDEINLFVNGGNLERNKGSSIYKLEYGELVQLRN